MVGDYSRNARAPQKLPGAGISLKQRPGNEQQKKGTRRVQLQIIKAEQLPY
jgi:hypothetical protein